MKPLTFTCVACGLDFDEPYCDCCGAQLQPSNTTAATSTSREGALVAADKEER